MLKTYSDKKIQEIEDYIVKRYKPILLVQGQTGIGKYTAVVQCLYKHNYTINYISQYQKDLCFVKQKHSLLYAMELQIESYKQDEAILLRELQEITNNNQIQVLRNLQRNYQCSSHFGKPLILIITSSITKDYTIKKIFGQQFLDQFCQIVNFLPPTLNKIKQLIDSKRFPISNTLRDEILEISNSNISTALNMLQIYMLDKRQLRQQDQNNNLTLFNILGKILYNKRVDNFGQIIHCSFEQMQQRKLYQYYFNPYQLIQQIQITQSAFKGFLFQNSINFFPSINEYSKFLELVQDIDILEKNNFKKERDLTIKCDNELNLSYLMSIGYMETNLSINQRTKKMMALQGPQTYDLQRQRNQVRNQIKYYNSYKPNQIGIVYKILRKPMPRYPITKQYYNSDETNINIDWFQEELEPQFEKDSKKPPTQQQFRKYRVTNGRNLIPWDKNGIMMEHIESLLQ